MNRKQFKNIIKFIGNKNSRYSLKKDGDLFLIPFKETQIDDNGIRQGKFIEYHVNGVIKKTGKYVDDKIEGDVIEYSKFGNKELITPYVNGKKNGIERQYYDDGIIMGEIPYKNDLKHGDVRYYYKNGNISTFETYKNGEIDGVSARYYDNGRIEMRTVNDNKLNIQMSTEYFKSGKIYREEFYDKNSGYIEFKEYNKNGDLIHHYTISQYEHNVILDKR